MKNKGLFQPLVLGTVLALGFLAVWGIVGIVVLEDGYMLATKNQPTDDLIIREDGTALIAHREEGVTSHRDLSGSPVAVSDDAPIFPLNGQRLPPFVPFQREASDWLHRVRHFTDGQSPRTAWYFRSDGRIDGTAYFVGSDIYSKTTIGYLGTSGFRAEMPPPEEHFPFAGAANGSRLQVVSPGQDRLTGRSTANRPDWPVKGQNAAIPCLVYILGLDSKIYEADLRKRTVRILVQERGIRSFAIPYVRQSPAQIDWQLSVRTDSEVVVVDKHGSEQQRYPIPKELREKPFIFGETTAGEAVMYWNKEQSVMDREDEYLLFWVRPDGRRRTAALTLPGRPVPGLRYILAALMPSPVTQAVVGVIRSQVLQESMEPTFSSALLRTISEFWPSWLLAQLLALGLAVSCYRRQVLYGTNRAERIAWPLFVLFLGLPGWIGYRFGRSWPVLASCPECGAAVPRDRENCLRCTNAFPRPDLRGTEVYA